ncbi:pirin-like protein [Limulus polyphemus]|uniref:Pirin-like protein n=1 Tax=Limulus polyphemus TaxID=6850 RepID=A0ABM1T8B9_LIMPO|nr:pirin-like protein [Limulus polyphemus]XP_022252125.1 pirin-like protein [Limulus polyphemus]
MPHIVHRTVSRTASLRVQKEGGGFLVRKVIGGVIDSCDPFLLLDHIGPVTYKPGEALGAPDHPHRGFETVTYVIQGGVKHEDSAGNKGELRSGWVQWMRAGSGLVHSEMPTEDLIRDGGTWEGFQLWINLPSKDKMIPPSYKDIPPESIPVVEDPQGGATVKVIAGECKGTKGAITTHSPILFLDIHLKPGSSFTHEIPPSYNGFAYVWRGTGHLGHDFQLAKTGTVGVLTQEGSVFLMKAEENEECNVLLVAGQPLDEPVVRYGPFVMTTDEEIQQAIEDYRNGKLGFVHQPDGASGGTPSADFSNQDVCAPLSAGPHSFGDTSNGTSGEHA